MTRTDPVRGFAPAKINFYLHIGEKRADGYHDLESLVAFAGIGDTLEFEHADGLSLAVEGPFAAGLEGDNLVTKTAQLFATKTGQAVNARITLTKNLPVASGIGGGSADAAATLRGLAELYPETNADLAALAAELGSDVPACLASKALMMRGRGERVDVLGMFPELPVVLVNPGVAVSTADVFRTLKSRTGTGNPSPGTFKDATATFRFLRMMRNDLEAPARMLAPVIGEVLSELARMPGIELARMSGSGATCFGLFESLFEAEMAATALARSHPGWWISAGSLTGA